MAKAHQIKALSLLRQLNPLLVDLLPKQKAVLIDHLELDLSFVTSVDAVGFAMFLARLSQVVERHRVARFAVRMPNMPNSLDLLNEMNAEQLLDEVLNAGLLGSAYLTRDLFGDTDVGSGVKDRSLSVDRSRVLSVLHIDPNRGRSRQEWIEYVRKHLREIFASEPDKSFNREQIYVVVTELVKNTIDHSNARALVGIELRLDPTSGRCDSVQIAYVDTGKGIIQSIRDYLRSVADAMEPRDAELTRKVTNGSATEFIRDAFTPDFTTKPNNGINFGVGLSLIQNGAKGANFTCMLLDALSAINITSFDALERVPHSVIRRGATKLASHVPLTFLLEWNRVR